MLPPLGASKHATATPGEDGDHSDQEGLLEDDRRRTEERRDTTQVAGSISGWRRRPCTEHGDYRRRKLRPCSVSLGSKIADQRRKVSDRPRAAAFIQEPSLKVRQSLVRRRTTGLGFHRRAGEPTDERGDVRWKNGGEAQRHERRYPGQLREPSPTHQRRKSGQGHSTLSIVSVTVTGPLESSGSLEAITPSPVASARRSRSPIPS